MQFNKFEAYKVFKNI